MSVLRAAAFFDLDGTLISQASMTSFLEFYFAHTRPAEAERLWREFWEAGSALRQAGATREQQNAWFYERQFADADIAELSRLAVLWLARQTERPDFFRHGVLARLLQHRAQGCEIVLVTGSFREIVALFAKAIGASTFLCAPLEEINGRYTGKLTAAPMIGAGKASAIQRYLAQHGIAADDCFAYGDDDSDIDMLNAVGKPHVVSNCTEGLLAHARLEGWPVVAADDEESSDAVRLFLQKMRPTEPAGFSL